MTNRIITALAVTMLVAGLSACGNEDPTADEGARSQAEASDFDTCSDAQLADLSAEREAAVARLEEEGSVPEGYNDRFGLEGANIGWAVLDAWPDVSRDRDLLASRGYGSPLAPYALALDEVAANVYLGPHQESEVDLLALEEPVADGFANRSPGPLAPGERVVVGFHTPTEPEQWSGVGGATVALLIHDDGSVSHIGNGVGSPACGIRNGIEQLAAVYAESGATEPFVSWEAAVAAIADGGDFVRWLQLSEQERIADETSARYERWMQTSPEQRTVDPTSLDVPPDVRSALSIDTVAWTQPEAWMDIDAQICSFTELGWGSPCVLLSIVVSGDVFAIQIPHRAGDAVELRLVGAERSADGFPVTLAVLDRIQPSAFDTDEVIWLEVRPEYADISTVAELSAAASASGDLLSERTQ